MATLLAAALITSGCSLSSESNDALVEKESVTIGTDLQPDEFERPPHTIPPLASSGDDKIIVRRPTNLLTVDLTGIDAREFGAVDLEVLEDVTDTNVAYVVHPTALSVKVGKNGRSLRQRFDPSIDGSPRVEFAAAIPEADDESWLSYKIFFEPSFDWNKGGKLPGLAGGNHPTFEGGDGTDGFSARLAWMPDGQMGVYLYHPDRPDELGELRSTFGTFQRKQWHDITQRVVMNSRGQSDGILEVWLDDLLVFSDHEMTWRTTGDFGADVFMYSAFYGGATAAWAPETTTFVRFADIVVSTTNDSLHTFNS